MSTFFSSLKGKKTYIIAVLLGVVSALQYLGYVDQETAGMVQTLLLGGGLAALRSGVKG
jgi:hypothetical protein